MIHWMYTQQLDTQDTEELKDKTKNRDQCMALCNLWVLADKMLIPRLQNMIMDKIVEIPYDTKAFPTSCAEYVWLNTSEDSPLRLWFLRMVAYGLNAEAFAKDKPLHYPKDMLFHLAVNLKETMSSTTKLSHRPERDDGPKYHVALPVEE